jgi:uncharacterized protein (UPF0332 family)
MTALEKAQNLLTGAEACWQGQSMEGCALCCYAAMFWAAIAILEHFGIKQTEWSHGGLRNRFGLELIKRCRVLSERFGEYLGSLTDSGTKPITGARNCLGGMWRSCLLTPANLSKPSVR